MATKMITSCFLALLSFTSFSQNSAPVAADDTASAYAGQMKSFMKVALFANDYDPEGDVMRLDTAFVVSGNSKITFAGPVNNYGLIRYYPDSFYYGYDTVYYVVCDNSLCDTGRIIIRVLYRFYEDYDYLNINNISARINASGSLFWDLNDQPSFEVPIGSGKHSIFNSELWIGGFRFPGELHFDGTRYGSAFDTIYGYGPYMYYTMYSFIQDTIWNKVWKINKSEIDYHIANWFTPGYTPPPSIINWPAHGDTTLGQPYYLSLFFDYNNDGMYTPLAGDYPIIRGDQSVFFIVNDFRYLQPERVGLEIHGTAYAFDCPGDSALFNTIFLNYQIINKTNYNYDSVYTGMFFDFDIGCAFDDYLATDVQRNCVFGYNGDAADGMPCSVPPPGDYGMQPPAQSLVFLKTPFFPPDGSDNLTGECGEIINGNGFNDGIIDNEELNMKYSMYFDNCSSGPTCDPMTITEYYQYLKGIWRDGQQLVYGANGYPSACSSPFSCVPARYFFPDSSDAFGRGTNCSPQYIYWNEITANNIPGDRRVVASNGPFSFNAYDTLELEFAFVYGRGSDAISSVLRMLERVDSVHAYYNRNKTPCGKFINLGIESTNQETGIVVFPNPAKNYLILKSNPVFSQEQLFIYDIFGRMLYKQKISKVLEKIDLLNYNTGIYLICVSGHNQIYSKPFIKY